MSNGCGAVFVGQTGSGKTHTMEGPISDRGLTFRALEELLVRRASRLASGTTTISLCLSMLEVYNETLVDLLAEPTTSTHSAVPVTIRYNAVSGTVIDPLTSIELTDAIAVPALLAQGHANRTIGGHAANAQSSRSHCVLTVTIVTTSLLPTSTSTSHSSSSSTPSRKKVKSKLHLIDLAGSERLGKTAATGLRLKEAQCINNSLSALGNVIAALGAGKTHVPYRSSKLTFCLQESLAGPSKVLMFVNISSMPPHAEESKCSLTFAARCRATALGPAQRQSVQSAQSAQSSTTYTSESIHPHCQ